MIQITRDKGNNKLSNIKHYLIGSNLQISGSAKQVRRIALGCTGHVPMPKRNHIGLTAIAGWARMNH